MYTRRHPTHAVRLARHVKRPAFELTEVLEEDGDKCSNILRGLFSCALEVTHSWLLIARTESDNVSWVHTTISPYSA